MKLWIKIDTNLLGDERFERLTASHGMKGLGTYLMIRLKMEFMANDQCQKHMLIEACCNRARRNLLEDIISNYNLFIVDENQLVSVNDTGSYACVPALAPEHAPEHAPIHGLYTRLALRLRVRLRVRLHTVLLDVMIL